MKINSKITEAAEKYVIAFLAGNLDSKFVYHNIEHTREVVKGARLIADESTISKHEKNIILVAAWFHDTGYTQLIDQHEDVGAVIAEEFLKEYGVDQDDIDIVKSCIIATHYPQHPLTEPEMILCDADLFHLSRKDFMKTGNLLREEWASSREKFYTDSEWIDLNIQFLADHRYHTQFCKQNRENKKNKNLQKLLSLKQSLETSVSTDAVATNILPEIIKKGKKIKEKEFGRGVETLFKIASGNHMRLSGMADNKAHILLSINSIIISVVLSVLAKKLTESTFLIVPTFLLMPVCLTTIVFAVLTTRPKVSKDTITEEQMMNKEVNLLFFGHFHQLEVKDYEWGVREMMQDNDYLYKTLTRDVYYLGKVLANKYRYLNIGYMIFMYGLIVSVAAFAISFFFMGQLP